MLFIKFVKNDRVARHSLYKGTSLNKHTTYSKYKKTNHKIASAKTELTYLQKMLSTMQMIKSMMKGVYRFYT